MSKISEVQAAFKAARAAGKQIHMFTSSDQLFSRGIPLIFTVGGGFFMVDGLYKMYTGTGKGDL